MPQLLVLAGDWILLLAAWELIGVASYLLIGFWFERAGVAPAATRAFAVTRVADAGLYIGVFAVISSTGSTTIAGAGELSGTMATVAGLGFLVAAIGKSAQAPLQGWLMDAMAGPTPVSALLHAATLVVAGVVLMVRASPFLPSGLLLTVGLVGGVSAVLTGLTAIGQRDLKRLLAASTSSQLGLMLLAIGAGSIPAAVFHLITHAAMKSSLFLAAGVFQHDRDSTAFDRIGGIGRQRRWPFVAFAVAGLALAGVPPLAGFWSKDGIIAAAMDSSRAPLLVPFAVVASGLTGVYIGRALRLLWRGEPVDQAATKRAGTGKCWMGAGLAGLTVLAATAGSAARLVDRLLDAQVPEGLTAMLTGVALTVVGLVAGWLLEPAHWPARIWQPMLAGFRIDGGLASLVVRPVEILAGWCDRLDRVIHGTVLSVGRGALAMAKVGRSADDEIHAGVLGTGRAAVGLATTTRMVDEDQIDGLIASLVHQTGRISVLARQVQTGLVHRELLVTVVGAAIVLILALLV